MDECDFLGLPRLKSEFQKTNNSLTSCITGRMWLPRIIQIKIWISEDQQLLDQLYNHQLLENSTPHC